MQKVFFFQKENTPSPPLGGEGWDERVFVIALPPHPNPLPHQKHGGEGDFYKQIYNTNALTLECEKFCNSRLAPICHVMYNY